MPWTVTDVDSHKKDLTPRQKRVWVRVANDALRRCMADGGSQSTCEGRAIRMANAVAGRTPAQQSLQELTVHLAGATVRYEVLDGQRYAVATVVPIREGVLNQFYVPAAEIAAFVQSWDGLAVPIHHPTNAYGEPVSVNSPTQLAQSIGRFFNARWDGERLTGEVWLNVDKCERLGGEAMEVLQRIEAGEPMECSTAFYAETDQTPGTWNNMAYLGTHRHLRPDHLAILPNAIGACSLEHGCGLRALHCACDGPCTCEEGDAAMESDADVKHPRTLRQALRTLFAFANVPDSEEAPPPDDTPRPDPDEAPDDDDSQPALPLPPAEEAATPLPQQPVVPTTLKGDRMLTKPELITRLIAHTHAAWTDDQAPMLQGLEERMLEQMLAEAERRQQEAPLTLKALQTELNTRDQALKAEYDQKLALHVQQLEEKQEREHLLAYFEQRGWTPEETALLPVPALRRMHQELDPVSYLGNGLPRLSAQAVQDNYPDDDPKYE